MNNNNDDEQITEQQPKIKAVNALINWAKNRWGYYSMRNTVNNYLESVVQPPLYRWQKDHHREQKNIAANRLTIDCIYALSKEELSKVDRELEGIVGNLQGKGLVFTYNKTYKSSPFALLYSLS